MSYSVKVLNQKVVGSHPYQHPQSWVIGLNMLWALVLDIFVFNKLVLNKFINYFRLRDSICTSSVLRGILLLFTLKWSLKLWTICDVSSS